MSEKLTCRELVIKVLENSDEPMSHSEIWNTAIKSKYAKLYACGTNNDQKKAQIGAFLSIESGKPDPQIFRYEKGYNGNTTYTYSLTENINDNEIEKVNVEEICDLCGALIDDCKCKKDIFNDEYIDRKIKRKHFVIQNEQEQKFVNNKIKICENFDEPENISENKKDGNVYINTNPYGDVIVYIYFLENNKFVPKMYKNTPCSFTLKPGKYGLLIRKSGYKTYEKSIIIEEYKTVNIEVGLIKLGKSANYEDINNIQQREHIPQKVKDLVWQRDKGRCVKCNRNEKLEFDHIIPVTKGGNSTYRNVQLLCELCNRSKSANI